MLHHMKLRAALIAFVLAALATGCKSGSHVAATASDGTPADAVAANPGTAAFDYYVLNLSWSPEFCYTHPSARECAEHKAFVLHGLWPQNNDGTYPESCSNAAGPTDPSAYQDIYPEEGVLAHEWKKHGTCSGLDAEAFLSTARSAYRSVKIPPEFASLMRQGSASPDVILGLFTQYNPAIPRASLALDCGHNYLTAVEVCLDKSLHPTACSGLRSCRANVVRIPPP
jgi:ribonuclease T2